MKIKDINDFKEGNHIFSFHIGSGSLIARFWMIKREIMIEILLFFQIIILWGHSLLD